MNDHTAPDNGAFWTRAKRHLLNYGGNFVPFVPVRAEGSFLYDFGGRRVLDFTSGQMSAILGHSHPEIVATVRDRSAASIICSPPCCRSQWSRWPRHWPGWCPTCRA